jgi:predicted nucleic acid-binding protein
MRFLDASALVKAYVVESGTEAVREFLRAGPWSISRLSVVECGSAFARKGRDGSMTVEQTRAAWFKLCEDSRRAEVVEITQTCSELARPLLQRHALRAGDAVQLASAIALRDRMATPVQFVCADARLAEAAAAEGLAVVVP